LALKTADRPSLKTADLFDQKLAKAFSHPLRMKILTILDRRVASPNELSKEIGEGLSQVSYHVKVLKDLQCIELVDTKPRRGAVEHYYRAIARPYLSVDAWGQVPRSMRQTISGEVIELTVQDAAEALSAGTMDARDDSHLSRTPLLLDEEGWADLAELLAGTLEGALDIQAESASRMAQGESKGIPSKLTLLHFESPEPKSGQSDRAAKP
jgi:DNA-binding transcriptional ArsR family regulator